MALNLWKVGGGQTAYNPLPIITNHAVPINKITELKITFKAKSVSSTKLNIWVSGEAPSTGQLTLTPMIKEYTVYRTTTISNGSLFIRDNFDIGDIIIESIELVEKPLPMLTINGISNELIDWESGSGNGTFATADNTRIRISNLFPLIPNTVYTRTIDSSYEQYLFFYDVNKITLSGVDVIWTASNNFTTPSNAYFGRIIVRRKDVSPITVDEVLTAKPMINFGSTPAPYEKKRGERMMLPVTVKKNIFDGRLEMGVYTTGTGVKGVQSAGNIRNIYLISVTSGKSYIIQSNRNLLSSFNTRIFQFDINKSYIRDDLGNAFTLQPTTHFIGFHVGNYGLEVTDLVQIEEGTVATPYEPYAVQVNPKPKQSLVSSRKGLKFTGKEYVSTANAPLGRNGKISVEFSTSEKPTNIMMLIDHYATVPQYGYAIFLTDVGLVSIRYGAQSFNNLGGMDFRDGLKHKIELDVTEARVILKIDDVIVSDIVSTTSWDAKSLSIATTIGYRVTDTAMAFKGTLYSAYVSNGVDKFINYDFTNSNNLVGDKILPDAKNLIPNFEDARWVLHANADVMGKDALRLESTLQYQASSIRLNALPNTNYSFAKNGGNGQLIITCRDINGNEISRPLNYSTANLVSFTSVSGTVFIDVALTNNVTGTFEFIKPQLYELDGKEGTVYGTPVSLNPSTKKSLYRKR